jgi:hypothetical protein
MATTEEDLAAKKTIQDAVWVWSGRILTLIVVFGAGIFTAYLMWGSGVTGAPALRLKVAEQEARILELGNKQVDVDGRLTVVTGRLEACQRDLAKARSGTP